MAKNPAPAPSRGVLPASTPGTRCPACGVIWPKKPAIGDWVKCECGLQGRVAEDKPRMSKEAKQRQEIARLTREVEQLRADKRNLLFDLNKERKANEQLWAERSFTPVNFTTVNSPFEIVKDEQE